jgi:hypothetical protein
MANFLCQTQRRFGGWCRLFWCWGMGHSASTLSHERNEQGNIDNDKRNEPRAKWRMMMDKNNNSNDNTSTTNNNQVSSKVNNHTATLAKQE